MTVALNERPITAKQAAAFMGYSEGYVRTLVSKKQIPFHKRGAIGSNGAVCFYESELHRWLEGFSKVDLNEAAGRILENAGK